MVSDLFIGKRLNKQRTELQLTLRDLADKTDLTASFLSQLERRMAMPSLSSLSRFLDELIVPYRMEG